MQIDNCFLQKNGRTSLPANYKNPKDPVGLPWDYRFSMFIVTDLTFFDRIRFSSHRTRSRTRRKSDRSFYLSPSYK